MDAVSDVRLSFLDCWILFRILNEYSLNSFTCYGQTRCYLWRQKHSRSENIYTKSNIIWQSLSKTWKKFRSYSESRWKWFIRVWQRNDNRRMTSDKVPGDKMVQLLKMSRVDARRCAKKKKVARYRVDGLSRLSKPFERRRRHFRNSVDVQRPDQSHKSNDLKTTIGHA